MLKMDEYVDMLIPRGGLGCINFAVNNQPFQLSGGIGVCHTFVDESRFRKSINGYRKCKGTTSSACNSLETLLVHENIADLFFTTVKRCYGGSKSDLNSGEKALAGLKKGGATVVDEIRLLR